MFNLSEIQKKKIEEICRRYGVQILLLFGSQIANKTTQESDIDLAFFIDKKLTFEAESKLNSELQNIFGTTRVDTVDLRKASPLLLKRIMDSHLPLFISNQNKYFEIQSYAIKSYIETKFLRDYLKDYLNAKYA